MIEPSSSTYGIVDTSRVHGAFEGYTPGPLNTESIAASPQASAAQYRINRLRPEPMREMPLKWWMALLGGFLLCTITGMATWAVYLSILAFLVSTVGGVIVKKHWDAWKRSVIRATIQRVPEGEIRTASRSTLTMFLGGHDLDAALRYGDPDLAGKFVCAAARYESMTGLTGLDIRDLEVEAASMNARMAGHNLAISAGLDRRP